MQFQNKVEEEEKITDQEFFAIGGMPKKKRSSTDPELFNQQKKIAEVVEDYDNENSDSEVPDYNQARKGGITQVFQIPPKAS